MRKMRRRVSTAVVAGAGLILMLTTALAQQRGQPQAAAPAYGLGGFATNSNEPIDIVSSRLLVNDQKKTALFTGDVVAVQGEHTLRTPELEVIYEGKASEAAVGGGPAGAKGKAAAAGDAGLPAAQPAEATSPEATQVRFIKARQKVEITSRNGQRATGDNAVFDARAQVATLEGNVVLTQNEQVMRGNRLVHDVQAQKGVLEGNVILTQGENVLRGERLHFDLRTGQARMETSPSVTPVPAPDGRACPPGRVCSRFHREEGK